MWNESSYTMISRTQPILVNNHERDENDYEKNLHPIQRYFGGDPDSGLASFRRANNNIYYWHYRRK